MYHSQGCNSNVMTLIASVFIISPCPSFLLQFQSQMSSFMQDVSFLVTLRNPLLLFVPRASLPSLRVCNILLHKSMVPFCSLLSPLFLVVLLQRQLEPSLSRPSQHGTLEACSVGGKQLHARHTASHVHWLSHPLNLFSSFSAPSLQFSIILILFSPQFLWQGGNLGSGGVYILVCCWSLHILSRSTYLHNPARLWGIILKSSVSRLMPFMDRGCRFMCEHAVCYYCWRGRWSWSWFSPNRLWELHLQPSIKRTECEGVPLWEGCTFGSVQPAKECDPAD